MHQNHHKLLPQPSMDKEKTPCRFRTTKTGILTLVIVGGGCVSFPDHITILKVDIIFFLIALLGKNKGMAAKHLNRSSKSLQQRVKRKSDMPGKQINSKSSKIIIEQKRTQNGFCMFVLIYYL